MNIERPEKAEKSGKASKGILQLVLVAVILVAAVMLSRHIASFGELPKPKQSGKEEIITVTAKTIIPGKHRIEFVINGTVQPKSYVNIVPQVSGRVIKVNDNVHSGGSFKAGEGLFQIDPADYELRLDKARARVAEAETRLEIEKSDVEAALKEWKLLYGNKKPPILVARKPQLKQAEAQLGSALAELSETELHLERSNFSLPFSGRVTDSIIEEGQYVTVGQSYGRAYSYDTLEIYAPLEDSQQYWLNQETSPKVQIKTVLKGKEVTYNGRFLRFSAAAEEATRFVTGIFGFAKEDIKNPDLANTILPGMFLEVKVMGKELDNVWVIPIEALQDNNQIWVVEPSNQILPLDPDIIQITKDHVVVRSNGNPVKIVIHSLRSAIPGAKVRVVE